MTNTTNYKTQTRELHVRGTLWSGGRSQYVYSLNGGPCTSLREAESLASDFESLDSATVIITNREVRETTAKIKLTA